MDKDWFEMRDQVRRKLADAAWIPLELSMEATVAEYGVAGYQNEYYGVHTVAVPIDHVAEGERFSWSDYRDAGVWVEDGVYRPADTVRLYLSEVAAVQLVLRQNFDGAVASVLHLNQDLAIALKLCREGGIWLRPRDGFAEVARLLRGPSGREIGIEIRAEYLRDYLAARSMMLRVCVYRSRRAILEDISHIDWSAAPFTEEVFDGRFEGRAWPIHEGGSPFGTETAVFHMSRTDVDVGAEVPVMESPSEEGVETRQWSIKGEGRKLFHVEGEFWRDEWIQPANSSPRVRGDHARSETTFVINGAGERASADDLNYEDVGKWLWFRPEIVPAILGRRGGALGWYTRDTGALEMSIGANVHFGLNERGLINAYAYDIARLDEWERRVWAGFNVAPDGGVSPELTASQVHAEPANTKAPEAFIAEGLDALDKAFHDRFGHHLMHPHPEREKIIDRTHRFRVTDLAGLLALAKDLARLTADSFDSGALKAALKSKQDDRLGSLKGLQSILASIIGEARARELMGPLVGVYDLRLGDAHLPSSKLDDALVLVGLRSELPWVHQGRDLIHRVVTVLFTAADVLAGEAITPEQRAQSGNASKV